MRALLLLLFFSASAHADLYRWVDPETGSVKLSSVPPSDPAVSAEVVPYKAPPLPKAATPAATKPAAVIETLQSRWTELLAQLIGVSQGDFDRAGEGLRQQIEAYQAVSVELDRLDPAGAARRRTESTSLLQRFKQGFAAQFSTVPPGQK